MSFILPFALSIIGGFVYSLLFVRVKEIQFRVQKPVLDVLITVGRIAFLGIFLYILLKSWPTHSILIVISFIISFILTTMVMQKT
jgi:hypothetical protein